MRPVAAVLLRSLLAAVVLMTALGLGVARGQAPVAGHVVFCGSDGVQLVAVDATGQPIEQAGHCPDCAALLTVPLPGVACHHGPSGALAGMLAPPVGAARNAPLSFRSLPPARAPPVGIAA